jgi:hypothetical protein
MQMHWWWAVQRVAVLAGVDGRGDVEGDSNGQRNPGLQEEANFPTRYPLASLLGP